MLTPITVLGTYGTSPAPGPGPTLPAGPVFTLTFVLPIAGPVPNIILPPVPQSCQKYCPNISLQAEIVDQEGNVVDLSTASSLVILLSPPDGFAQEFPATLVSNGLDGLLQYLTVASDLNEVGSWGIQSQITYGATVLRTRWAYFSVEKNISDS